MPRERAYASNAERQAAYRARVAERQRLAGSDQLTTRLGELEAALAAVTRRAGAAEARAARAERDAVAVRDRFAATLARLAELEETVAELRHRLAATTAPAAGATSGLNRAARRAAERDRRRGR